MPSYTRPGWMSWEDRGGQWFGDQDVTEALRRGVSVSDIKAAVEASDTAEGGRGVGGAGDLANRLQAAFDAAQSGTLGHGFGANRDYTGSADLAIYGQGRGASGATTGQIAQEIASQANWRPQSLDPSSDIGGIRSNIEGSAASQTALDTAQTTAANTAAFQASEAAKSEEYYQNMLASQQSQLDAFQAADDRRARDALKVKYQGSSAVGRGAGGVRLADPSSVGSSGVSRMGTAQLSRSGKGSELKTLNV